MSRIRRDMPVHLIMPHISRPINGARHVNRSPIKHDTMGCVVPGGLGMARRRGSTMSSRLDRSDYSSPSKEL